MQREFEELRNIDRVFLAQEADKIIRFANENLEQLYGRCQVQDTTQDYFLGLIRRQTIILHDINLLLISSRHNNFNSLFVLCRCLADDFLFVSYLSTHEEKQNEDIVRINASAYNKSFKALEVLVDSNEKHFNGKYPFYFDRAELEKYKSIFKSKEENDKYFKDKNEFIFKSFLQLTQIAEHITEFEFSKTTLRAFYLWKEFSDFIHYSNLTYELEIRDDLKHIQVYLRQIEETLMYSFNTIEMAFRYFTKRYNLGTIWNDELKSNYFINL